jgi:hypothetical protein
MGFFIDLLLNEGQFGKTTTRQKSRNRVELGLDSSTKIKLSVGKEGIFAIMNVFTSGGNGVVSEKESIQVLSNALVEISPLKYYSSNKNGDYFFRGDISPEMEKHYKVRIDNNMVLVEDKKAAEIIAKKFD